MSVDFCRSARDRSPDNRAIGNSRRGKSIVSRPTFCWSSFGLILLTLIAAGEARTAYASENDGIEFSARVVVSDLNVMAPHLLQTEIANFQVALIASAGCSSLRFLAVNQDVRKAVNILADILPNNLEQENVDEKTFSAVEREIFFKIGATEYSAEYLDRNLMLFPILPPTAHNNTDEVQSIMKGLANEVCEFRNEMIERSLLSPTESASVEDQSFAHCVGLKVLGGAIILGNVAVAVGTIQYIGPYAAQLVGVVSGGWGWNRIEAACA